MEQQAALIAMVLGAKPAWPSVEDSVEAFERALVEAPPQVDHDEIELRRALGLRG